MKNILYFIAVISLFLGCTKEEIVEVVEPIVKTKPTVTTKPTIVSKNMPKTYLIESDFTKLPQWNNENYNDALDSFINSCKTKRTKNLYNSLCKKAKLTKSAKLFLEKEFQPYKIKTKKGKETGLLTGYYEPELKGSLRKSRRYKYPIYNTPSDLVIVDLGSIYPELKNMRLRGRMDGNRLVPYDSREKSTGKYSDIICYVDSKIDLFFLEIQGSGRVTLSNGKTIFVGYDNQNGHKYRAIGRYLVKKKELKMKNVSLQSIRAWLEKNPSRVNEVLNYNKSVVYFKKRKKPASGSLGLELTPSRSVAVDRHYIPLGTMLYLSADIDKKNISKIVLAQDTGGAIKGAIRADMFLGFGNQAMNTAGRLKSKLNLWVLLPKI